MDRPLTAKQHRTLTAFRDLCAQLQRPPCVREVSEHLQMKDPTGAYSTMRELCRTGHLIQHTAGGGYDLPSPTSDLCTFDALDQHARASLALSAALGRTWADWNPHRVVGPLQEWKRSLQALFASGWDPLAIPDGAPPSAIPDVDHPEL